MQSYKHGVIRDLITPNILRSVIKEIQSALSFSPKETDIYRIHQSGDLANLDGLDDASLSRLPSLLQLRDALYSSAFRTYLSRVTGSGPLSGERTDMSINVYTPGCHLLCHDDVIGSRRVSFILYLTDPDRAWKSEWGGALRLYPTVAVKGERDGIEGRIPSPDFSVSIPPAFNQLSFFAVQPGESFHDVEEVYSGQPGEEEEEEPEGDRVRMAISGWYHIPQKGEEGYVEDLEQQLAAKSSLVQLQGKADRFDLPETQVCRYDVIDDKGQTVMSGEDDEELELSEKDLDFLLQYLAPTYLTPDTLEALQNAFLEESWLTLDGVLNTKFGERLRQYIEDEERTKTLPRSSTKIEEMTEWRVARPPHKHRFLYQQQDQSGKVEKADMTPIQELLNHLLPSIPFRKWLSLTTGVKVENYDVLARRFRRGCDYTLATGLDDLEDGRSRVEVRLCVTPMTGWVENDGEEGDQGKKKKDDDRPYGGGGGVGGYEVYMADEQKNDKDVADANDPAIYQSSNNKDDDDDGILLSIPVGWNKLCIVLRDQGILNFVKYIGRDAPSDRWDVVGAFDVADDEDDNGDDGGGADEEGHKDGNSGVDEEGHKDGDGSVDEEGAEDDDSDDEV